MILLLSGALAISMSVDTSPRIGYVYMEQVLGSMSETQEMNRILERFMLERQQELDGKRAAFENAQKDFQEKERKGELTEAGRIIAMNELKGLQAEYETAQTLADQELNEKRAALIRPIAQQLKSAMNEVAKKEGYTHVLNSADGTGNSIVIVAPEADDLTLNVMKHLGVKMD